jgi:hypothetical protein
MENTMKISIETTATMLCHPKKRELNDQQLEIVTNTALEVTRSLRTQKYTDLVELLRIRVYEDSYGLNVEAACILRIQEWDSAVEMKSSREVSCLMLGGESVDDILATKIVHKIQRFVSDVERFAHDRKVVSGALVTV